MNGLYKFISEEDYQAEKETLVTPNVAFLYNEDVVMYDKGEPHLPLKCARILGSDNKLYKASEWDTQKTAVAVYVSDDKGYQFLVDLQEASDSCQWGDKTLIQGVPNEPQAANLSKYIKGEEYTIAITQSSTTSATAAKICTRRRVDNQMGYLGSTAEWMIIVSLFDDVNTCLQTCGGTQLSGGYWTSVQGDSASSFYIGRDAWMVFPKSHNDFHAQNKTNNFKARAFSQFMKK